MKRGPKIIYLGRKVLAAVGCLAEAVFMCWVSVNPKVVGAASTERQLPICCVQKESGIHLLKMLMSVTPDA